jgi:ribosomal protein S18 acetylase RimI-like enzyme
MTWAGWRLVPFRPEHAAAVAGWARTPAEVRAWCGRLDAPVPAEVVAGWSAEDGVTAWLLVDGDDGPVGYGQLWVDDGAAEVEIARVIVDPARRNGGAGRDLVRRLVARARALHPAVFLRLLPDNAAALHCYTAAGFTRVPAADEREWNRAQPAAYLWMTHLGQ